MEQTTTEAAVQLPGGQRLKKAGGRKPLLILGIAAAVVLAAYAGLCAYARSLTVFFPNTTIDGVDVAGLTVDQAGERLRQTLPQKTLAFYLPRTDASGDDLSAPEGALLYDETPAATVTYGQLGLTDALDYTSSASLVFRNDRQMGFFAVGGRYLSHLLGWQGAAAAPEPDGGLLQETLSTLTEQFSTAARDTSYTLDGDGLRITVAQNGRRVSASTLESAVRAAMLDAQTDAVWVEAAILPAQTLSAQNIYDVVSGEMKNAGYDAATDAITPEQIGAEFDVAAAQALMDAARPGETVSPDAALEFPRVTADALKSVLFRDVLGTATTHVGGTAARISNVKLAAEAFNGTVLNCGDIFSYNETVGQRTAARGYQAAPAYVKGETVDEIGGGVCQPSSTLYLACLRSNLEITERYAHRYAPSYIGWGMDATVSWGGPDYRFSNDTDYPVKIVTSYVKGNLTVKLLGTKTDKTTVKMTSETLSDTPFEVVYQDDDTLAPGTEEVKVTPYTGHKVKTYRNLYGANGKLISSTLEAVSDYKSRNKIILRGPALPAVSQDETIPAGGSAALPVEPEEPAPETPVSTPTEPERPAEETPILVIPTDEGV